MIENLTKKVKALKKLITSGSIDKPVLGKPPPSPKPAARKSVILERKSSLKRGSTEAEEAIKRVGGLNDPLLLEKLESYSRSITREVKISRTPIVQYPVPELTSYIEGNSSINYGRLLTDEVLAVDRLLVEAAKKNLDVAGKC